MWLRVCRRECKAGPAAYQLEMLSCPAALRVIVTGQLRQNTFERKDGTKGSSVEIIASEIAASVLWGTTTFTKA